MDVVVNDTNIFIDLFNMGLLDDTMKLPLNFHTVDYVIHEIEDEKQKQVLEQLISNNKIQVKSFDENEMTEILNLYTTRSNNVSITDCAVWLYAKNNNYRLLTGDNKLRSSASNDGVIVSGILFITDKLVEHNITSKQIMIEKLQTLLISNKRLPKKLIEDRIQTYKEG